MLWMIIIWIILMALCYVKMNGSLEKWVGVTTVFAAYCGLDAVG